MPVGEGEKCSIGCKSGGTISACKVWIENKSLLLFANAKQNLLLGRGNPAQIPNPFAAVDGESALAQFNEKRICLRNFCHNLPCLPMSPQVQEKWSINAKDRRGWDGLGQDRYRCAKCSSGYWVMPPPVRVPAIRF